MGFLWRSTELIYIKWLQGAWHKANFELESAVIIVVLSVYCYYYYWDWPHSLSRPPLLRIYIPAPTQAERPPGLSPTALQTCAYRKEAYFYLRLGTTTQWYLRWTLEVEMAGNWRGGERLRSQRECDEWKNRSQDWNTGWFDLSEHWSDAWG